VTATLVIAITVTFDDDAFIRFIGHPLSVIGFDSRFANAHWMTDIPRALQRNAKRGANIEAGPENAGILVRNS